MQEVAYALDEGLPSHGVDSTIVDLERGLADHHGRTALPQYWESLRRLWRREDPDVVMAHTMKNALFSLTAARMAGVERRIVVVHASRPSLGKTRTRILELLCATGTCTDVVFVGQAAADTFIDLAGSVHRRAVVIRNGIRLPEASSTDSQKEGVSGRTVDGCRRPADLSGGETPQLVIAGRLDVGKGVDIAIKAVQRMDREVLLHVYGDGELRHQLEGLAVRGPHPERIVLHGAVSRDQLMKTYRESSLLLFPSLAEGLPLVLVEAAAAGIPVIAGPLTCNREVLGDAAACTTGSDPDEWAALITDVLEDPARREAMVKAGLERVEHFTLARMVQDYAQLLTAKP
ncbi:MAG: glycosyltransferase family 4 protein [Luteococcus sp.]|uniref:glycosyltransferase family 4 protein n=1 Tax=Luteococcus sp. TaxID=1969402 RepID=UPI002647234F|nr:glycosyltransferase family 4 protein [Luteococcus sp.]MDN5563763.1 glycosyltransferase family 4 protein [Luteococcus sp.]